MLTKRQAQVYAMIRAYADKHGYPPTRQEIAEHFGFASWNAAQDHVKALVRKGVLEKDDHLSRGIRLVEDGLIKQAIK